MDTPGARRTVLFFHGNRRRPTDYALRLSTLAGLGVNAFLFDYRGFGQSEGCVRRESDIYLDGQAAWDYLHMDRQIPARDIILWGRSMGGAVAVEVARQQPAGLLVLELAKTKGITVREAGEALLNGKHWQELYP